MPNILLCFVVGGPGPEYGLPVAVLYETPPRGWNHESFNIVDVNIRFAYVNVWTVPHIRLFGAA